MTNRSQKGNQDFGIFNCTCSAVRDIITFFSMPVTAMCPRKGHAVFQVKVLEPLVPRI